MAIGRPLGWSAHADRNADSMRHANAAPDKRTDDSGAADDARQNSSRQNLPPGIAILSHPHRRPRRIVAFSLARFLLNVPGRVAASRQAT
jgi:hypothetical protein